MRFILVGPNFGASGVWGGFRFRDGVCDVPADGVENTAHILGSFYSAYPEDQAEEKHFEYLDSLEDPEVRKAEEAKMNKFVEAHGGSSEDDGDEKHAVDLTGQGTLDLGTQSNPAEQPHAPVKVADKASKATGSDHKKKG